ncbi:MAG: Transcriptional regulator, XRE family protein [uncultured bacterium]|nr:MAG: Transcriptional regulator, XRE family protein [uncultured bacterium]
MLMHNPPHPGQMVRRILIEEAHLSVTGAAKALGIGRVTLSKLLNKKSGISPEMAIRLSLALNTSSEMWINMQSMYDLWHAEKKRKKLRLNIKKIKIQSTAHAT